MPKSDKSKSRSDPSLEMRLVELIREKPELYDSANHHYRDNNRKIIIWEYISEEMNTPVETLKKLWKKLRFNYTKKWRDLQEAEKMTKSTPCDEALAFLMTSVLEYADENNRGNNISSSATTLNKEDERKLRSSSHLTSISEENRSTTTLVPEEKKPVESRDSDPPLSATLSLENFGVCKTSDRVLRPRHSEPSRLASRDILGPGGVDVAPRRMTVTPAGTTPSTRSRNRKLILDPNNSTRIFFDSMAITVSSFPQYLQALVKLQICKIVSETECDLSSPKIS